MADLSVVRDSDGGGGAEPQPIAVFEGQGVFKSAVEIRNAAGGLNEALEIEPRVDQIGDTLFVVLRCDVTGVEHRPIKGDEGNLARVHALRATDCTIADAALVSAIIDDQRAKIQKRRDEIAGQKALFEDERAKAKARAREKSSGEDVE
jgi:hypothetical protein